MDCHYVKKDIESLKEISAIPVTMRRVLEVLQDESASLTDLSDVIKHDQSLVHKVVSTANSPYFSYCRKINTIEQATMVLGFDLIKSIVFSIAVWRDISGKDSSYMKRLWAHSFEVAVLSSIIGGEIYEPYRGICFLGGLLHDIGRPVLYTLYKDRCSEVMDREDILSAEYEVFGCNHADTGNWFLENTFLPKEICLSVKHHHHFNGLMEHKDIVISVNLAEAMLSKLSSTAGHDGEWDANKEKIFLDAGLNNNFLSDIEYIFRVQKENLKAFFELS
ncbi:MAG: HDOD domain-containing protein [Thermodesulfovibrionales bacterium]|nr:HDOD domain-containing protein [Thermodesulfovibrionales bacterium]